MPGVRHVDMRKLPAAAQEERRRQVIGLRQRGVTYREIAALAGLSPGDCRAGWAEPDRGDQHLSALRRRRGERVGEQAAWPQAG